MGNLAGRPAAEHRVLLLGLHGSGKTHLLYRMLGRELEAILPTIGFIQETVRHKRTTFHISDIGGSHARDRPLPRHHFPGTAAVVFVIDGVNTADLGDTADLGARHEGPPATATGLLGALLAQPELEGAVFLVLVNKRDDPECVSLEAARCAIGAELAGVAPTATNSPLYAIRWPARGDAGAAQRRGRRGAAAMLGCSASTGEGLAEALDWLEEALR